MELQESKRKVAFNDPRGNSAYQNGILYTSWSEKQLILHVHDVQGGVMTLYILHCYGFVYMINHIKGD